ncbi:MAG: OAM dimerization domain-containing protein [Tissierellia bacterium]|nr:OAM dimerization domain-containing protein [Tissierellia bacterium]
MTAGMHLNTNDNLQAEAVDLTKVRAYGDTLNDGKVQMSFTLPVPVGLEAEEAAKQIVMKQGFQNPSVIYSKDLGIEYTYFIVYAEMPATIDFTQIKVPKVTEDVMSREEVEDYIRENLGREITIVGACTGSDAHTVGIDAIMNMKGFAGHYGLERYEGINALNMGSQVPNEELIAKAIEMDADAILISQVVTQQNAHIPNMTQLIELAEAEGIRDRMLICCGGPRINYELAKELGYDAGFGQNTFAEDVATYIVETLAEREREK